MILEAQLVDEDKRDQIEEELRQKFQGELGQVMQAEAGCGHGEMVWLCSALALWLSSWQLLLGIYLRREIRVRIQYSFQI
jgi:hypothetical protein